MVSLALRRLDAWFWAAVPRERLTLLRFCIGAYAVIYLTTRAGHLNAAASYPATSFFPVGIVRVLDTPLPAAWVYGVWALTLVLGVAFTLGAWYRVTAPVFALLLLWVLSYRHSWGMIFHTDNLLVIHVLLLSAAPVSDAAGGRRTLRPIVGRATSGETSPGWVIRALCLVTVASYVVAAVAKLSITGLSWANGDALREQIAYDALRKIELGSVYSPIGTWLLPHAGLFPALATFSLLTELLAPLALLGPRWALVWCLAAWSFHVGVLGLMAIVFPYPLSGVAFVCFFPIERGYFRVRAWLVRHARDARAAERA